MMAKRATKKTKAAVKFYVWFAAVPTEGGTVTRCGWLETEDDAVGLINSLRAHLGDIYGDGWNITAYEVPGPPALIYDYEAGSRTIKVMGADHNMFQDEFDRLDNMVSEE